MSTHKTAPNKDRDSRRSAVRILGLPMWQGVSAIAGVLVLAITAYVAWPRSVPHTPKSGVSPHLELDNVQVSPKTIERNHLPAFVDQVYFSLRNTGRQLAVITGLRLEVQQFTQIPECYSSGSLGTTGWSTVGLPTDPRPGEVVTVPVSQQMAPDSADKFEVSLHVSKAVQGLQFYRLRTWIAYDQQTYLAAGYLLVSLPVEPQDGGYFWTRDDQVDPGRLKPFTTDLQSLSHCLIINSKRLHAILRLPGNRSAGLSSLPSELAFRY